MHVVKYYNIVPYATLQLTQPTKGVWYIKLNGEVIHQIKSILAFYRALGYPDISTNIFKMKDNYAQDEVLLNEYIQAKFLEEKTMKYSHCLKYKITEYLIKNCDIFKTTYDEISLKCVDQY